jgi:hypothetical protein
MDKILRMATTTATASDRDEQDSQDGNHHGNGI